MQDREQSGFFLVVNAFSLIIWSGGMALGKALEGEPWAGSLPYLVSLIIPANFLYYAVTRPQPISPFWGSKWAIFVVFLPALILTGLEDYTLGDQSYFSYEVTKLKFDSMVTRLAFLYSALMIGGATVILAIRYYTSYGPEKTLPKHLISTLIAPLLFAGAFWASTLDQSVSFVPSPSFVTAIMAQLGIIVVLRQEEIERPRFLIRSAYYVTAVLIAFLLVYLLIQIYTLVVARPVLEKTELLILVVVALAVLLMAKMGGFHSAFDRVMFSRAVEYRKLFHETRKELREARERLRKTERLSVVGEVAARIAHEIKNPLGPIKGYTQMMREKLEKDPDWEYREAFLSHLEVVAEEVENIDRRVRQLLDMARQPKLFLEPTDLNKLVERCANLIRLELPSLGDPPTDSMPIVIRTDLDEELEEIEADQQRLEEAFFNLARNALHATHQAGGGCILLKTRRASGGNGEEGVSITVYDAGEGFPEERINQLFSPFYTDKEGGTGLGLSIVKSHVEAHGGTIILLNGENGGGCAKIWLPSESHENPGALLPRA